MYAIIDENEILDYGEIRFCSIEQLFGHAKLGDTVIEVSIERQKGKDNMNYFKFDTHRFYKLWNVSALETLIKKGADVHSNDDALFQVAALRGKIDVVKYLHTHHHCNISLDSNKLLRNAILKNHFEVATYFLENSTARIADDDSLLWLAVSNRNFELVKLLVDEHQCLVNQKSNRALILASELNQIDILKYLIAQGGNPHIKNSLSQEFLLFRTAAMGNINIFKYLIEECHCIPDKTTLCAAALNKRDDITIYLRNHPAYSLIYIDDKDITDFDNNKLNDWLDLYNEFDFDTLLCD